MKKLEYSIFTLIFCLLFTLIFCLVLIQRSYATHVVGGDFIVNMISNTSSGAYYDIKVRFYRDNGGPNAAYPNSLTVGIYEVDTRILRETVVLDYAPTSTLDIRDKCYVPDINVLSIQERIYHLPSGTSDVFLPDHSSGYYLETQVSNRNNLSTNLLAQQRMVWFAMIPDPDLGQNSLPDFGDYPLDAFFCTGSTKYIQWSVIDSDGDQLVYSLVNPLNAGGNSGTSPGSLLSYPFYPSCTYQTGYSLNNYLGNLSSAPMSIDPNTGVITATPDIMGFFTFAVRVEEYRNGVKIGEVRRDVQYESTPCSFWKEPNIVSDNSILAYVNDSICFDIMVEEQDLNNSIDTQYIQISSSNFDLQANFVNPIINGSNSTYTNWMNTGNDLDFPTLGVDSNMIGPGPATSGYGIIPLRYCWVPECEMVDTIININIVGIQVDTCERGVDTVTLEGDDLFAHISQQDLDIHVISNPAPAILNVPGAISVSYGDEMCIDLFAQDTINIDDTLFIEPSSANFDFAGTYVPPTPDNNGNYYYDDFMSYGNTFYMTHYDYSNGIVGAEGNVGLRFCWNTDCNYIIEEEFELSFDAYSGPCGASLYKETFISVEPPVGEVDSLPNVFTPNGDYVNDYFQLSGISDPCFDFMMVKIFNRWGKMVFESSDPDFQWDGTNESDELCSEGTYYVLIDGSFGSSYDNSGELMPNLVKDEYWIQMFR